MGDKTLTPKQQAFVREYLIDLNGTQGAIRAGYSAKTAQEQSSRLLSNVIISSAVAEALAERANKAGIDALWVLTEARDTYHAARAADKLGEAVSALKLVGTHIDIQAFKERVAQEHSLSGEAAKWLGR